MCVREYKQIKRNSTWTRKEIYSVFSKLPRPGISLLVCISHWSSSSSSTIDSLSSRILGCGVLAWKGNPFASSNWFRKFWAKRCSAISLIWLMFTWSNTWTIHSAVWSWGWVSCLFQSSAWFQLSLFPQASLFPQLSLIALCCYSDTV